MKNIKTLFILTVFTAAAFGCSGKNSVSSSADESAAVSPESISFEWQNAYENKLKDFISSEKYNADEANGSRFDIADITGDGTPELIISPDTEKQTVCEIYTYSGGAISEVGAAGFSGSFEYLPEQSLIHEEYHGDGFVIGKYRAFSGADLSDVITYSDNSESAASGATIVHEINGEEVLLPEYDSALEPYIGAAALIIGRRYTLGEAAVNYGIRRAESWGAVLTPTQKELCKAHLTGLIGSLTPHEDSSPAFELCDLNGDDIPEIIVSDGDTPDSVCKIYYFSGDEIAELPDAYGHGGALSFDIEKLVFFSSGDTSTTYWSLADSGFSAADHISSGSIMETGRKHLLTEAGITASLQ